MAKRNIIVSDLSGEEVTEEEGAQVRVTYTGGDRKDVVRTLDLTAKEADELLEGGRESKKRGRKNATPAAAKK